MAITSFNKQELTDITELLGRGLNDIKQQNKEGNASFDGDTDDDLKERDRLEASGQHLVKKLSEMETRLSPKSTDQGKHRMPNDNRKLPSWVWLFYGAGCVAFGWWLRTTIG